MAPLAVAAWGAAWFGTWGGHAGIAAAGASVTVGLAAAALRRSALLLAVALVTAVTAGAGTVDLYRIRHGPVALLATDRLRSRWIWRFAQIPIASPEQA